MQVLIALYDNRTLYSGKMERLVDNFAHRRLLAGSLLFQVMFCRLLPEPMPIPEYMLIQLHLDTETNFADLGLPNKQFSFVKMYCEM